MKVLFIVWLILVAILICVRMQVHVQWPAITADAQAPTATPTPSVGGSCTITGNVINADGTPLVNGTISFNSTRIQVVGSTVVNPTYVSTNTDSQGNLRAIALPMGLVMQVTICPPTGGQGTSSNCAAPFSIIVPFANTADFGSVAQGTNLTSSSTLQLTTLSVTGTLNYPDGSTYSVAGHNSMAAVGIGVAAPTTAGQLLHAVANVNAGATIIVDNNSNGTGASSGIDFHNDDGTGGWLALSSSTYTGQGPAVPADNFQIGSTGKGGINIATNFTTAPGPPIYIWSGNQEVTRFVNNPPQIQGLQLLGFANEINGSEAPQPAAVSLGNSYLSATNWANLNISGAAYPNAANTGWIADGGAGSGTALLQVGGGPVMYAYYAGGMTSGTAVAWNPMMTWGPQGADAVHLTNNQNYGVPTVSGGQLAGGSRDTFGWIINVPGNQTTLTFAKPFSSGLQSTCVLTDAGQPNLWYAANQSNTAVTFVCVTLGGAACPGGQWVEYICGGMSE